VRKTLQLESTKASPITKFAPLRHRRRVPEPAKVHREACTRVAYQDLSCALLFLFFFSFFPSFISLARQKVKPPEPAGPITTLFFFPPSPSRPKYLLLHFCCGQPCSNLLLAIGRAEDAPGIAVHTYMYS